MNRMEEMWDFPVMEGVDFPNANRVHPLMQRRVEKLIRHLRQDENIKRAALFGSSLEFRCSSYNSRATAISTSIWKSMRKGKS